MALLTGKYTPHLSWLAILVVVFAVIAVVTRDGAIAAYFVKGILATLIDPLIWLIALVPAIKIRRNVMLILSLFILAALVATIKLYLTVETGSPWITGSILGNVAGFITVGYIINAVAVFRRNRAQPVERGA